MFGLQLFSLANMAVSGLRLHEEAGPYLRELVKQTGLTVHMAILEHREAVLVSKSEPPGIFRLATWIGKRMDLHCTGLGKALMACLSRDEVDQIIEEHGLPRHNDNTICSRKRLRQELTLTAQRGYSVDDEEDELGLRCIGAPVFWPNNHVIASISIAGMIAQIPSEDLRNLAERVMRTASSISQALARDPAAQQELPWFNEPAYSEERIVAGNRIS